MSVIGGIADVKRQKVDFDATLIEEQRRPEVLGIRAAATLSHLRATGPANAFARDLGGLITVA